jgi:hypothetical protein
MRWLANRQRLPQSNAPPFPEEALPVVDYALVFPPGLLEKIGEGSDLLLFRQTLS